MGNDDALYRFRLGVFALARELGNVRAACRVMGIHHPTFYRWKHQMERHGLDILRPRERRRPRMPNATSPFVEHRIVAFALGHPGFGPARISAELCRAKWGGIVISPSGVWRVLRRHGLNTRGKRLGLVAGYAAPPQPEKPPVLPQQHLQVEVPGELVQMDCFYVGRLRGVKGAVWQYTARRGVVVHLGRVVDHPSKPRRSADQPARPAGSRRPLRPRMETPSGDVG